MKPSIRNEIPPFGYAIVDKDGEILDDGDWFSHDRQTLENDLDLYNDDYSAAGHIDPKCPYRIIELYTKEQLEKELEILRSKAFASGREILRLREKFEAVHGIVQPNSLEPAKGDL